MNFENAFPLRFWINSGQRENRRLETETKLEEAGLSAERLAAVQARWMKGVEISEEGGASGTKGKTKVRGYESAGRYALALAQRLAIREAARRRVPAVLLFEDDVVLHPNFRVLIEAVELPEDWGIFYLGCAHGLPPTWAGNRVVRANWAVDTPAIAIKAPYYKKVMEILDRHGRPDPGIAKAADQFIALLHKEVPTYACYPNLAWQDVSESNLIGKENSIYHGDGLQRRWGESVSHLLPELVGERIEVVTEPSSNKKPPPIRGEKERDVPEILERAVWRRKAPRLGLLFLTRGDVNHPRIWQEFVAESPDRVRVFSHVKNARTARLEFLRNTRIKVHYETEWGGLGLVKASRAMLLEALEDESLTHFVLLSESCVPIRPLPEILRRLEIDPRPQFGYRTLKDASARQRPRAEGVPQVPKGCWRFQSQWWLLDRVAATFSAGQDFTGMFEKMIVPDEAYFATVLAMQGYPLDGGVLKKDVTWTWWEKDAGSPNEWPTLPEDKLREMLHSGALFARKFPVGADIGKYDLHRSAAGALAREMVD